MGYYLSFLFFNSSEKSVIKAVWIHPGRVRFKCIIIDLGLGLLIWVIAFPIVTALSQFVESIVYFLTGYTELDQVAVRFLKMAEESPYLASHCTFCNPHYSTNNRGICFSWNSL